MVQNWDTVMPIQLFWQRRLGFDSAKKWLNLALYRKQHPNTKAEF